MDGRPLWQLPVSKNSALIGKGCEKKREIVMKYFDGDQPNTEFMNEETKDEIESMYIYPLQLSITLMLPRRKESWKHKNGLAP